MTEAGMRRTNMILAALFVLLIVGITVNTYRVQQGAKRDHEAAACMRYEIEALQAWALARSDQEVIAQQRDQALAPLFDQLIRGEKVHSDTAKYAKDALAAAARAREEMERVTRGHPLTECELLKGQP